MKELDPMPSANPNTATELQSVLEWCARNGYEPIEHDGIGIFIGGKRWWIDSNGFIDMKRPDDPRFGEVNVHVLRRLISKIECHATYPASPAASRPIYIRVLARVDAARHMLCADECPCHNFDDANRRVCGAFDRILGVPPDEPEDNDGNLLTARCPECLAAVDPNGAEASS